MATKDTTTANPEKSIAEQMEELVEYTAPLGASVQDERPLLVAVNGEEIRIQRGETVKIKRKFVEAIQNANRQAHDARAYQRAAIKASAKAVEM